VTDRTATVRTAAGYLRSWVEAQAGGRSPLAAVTIRELLGHQAGVVQDGAHAHFWQLEQPVPDHSPPGIEELEVADADTLRVAAQPGFGPPQASRSGSSGTRPGGSRRSGSAG
jgi:hypothetical protein